MFQKKNILGKKNSTHTESRNILKKSKTILGKKKFYILHYIVLLDTTQTIHLFTQTHS